MTRWRIASALCLLSPLLLGATSPPVPMRLYTLDCGRIDIPDLASFSDTGDYDGEHEAMPVPCFLIRHGTEWMLWDAGLGDEIAASPDGRQVVGLHFRVPRTLSSQLAELKLKPADVHYVGLSHLHADHSGNAALFPDATFLVAPEELKWAGGDPVPGGVRADAVAAVLRSRIEPVSGDKDVFGDGSVRMLSTPGHTPGHHSLMVRLAHSGPIILSGDVAHFKVSFDKGLVPQGNASRAETLASIDRLKGLAAHFHARVVVQHAVDVFAGMPKSPKYLE